MDEMLIYIYVKKKQQTNKKNQTNKQREYNVDMNLLF